MPLARLLVSPPPVLAAGSLKVGVLDGAPPCSGERSRGQWQGRALDLWEVIARREGLAYVMRGYGNPSDLMEATRAHQIDIAAGCLTFAPERVDRYRFSLPFQERGLALLLPVEAGNNEWRLLSAVVNVQLLKVVGGYLSVIALISALVWLDEYRDGSKASKRQMLHRHAFESIASQ